MPASMAKIALRLIREAASYANLHTESVCTASIPAAGKRGTPRPVTLEAGKKRWGGSVKWA